MSKWAVRLFAMISMSLSAGAFAAQTDLTPGKDYSVLSPAQRTDEPNKIVVTEFFSYACPHCFAFFPLVSSWAAKLPQDVVFQRVPVTFGRANWGAVATAYYAMEATGALTKLDSAFFNAIHVQNLKLDNEDSIVSWVGKQGMDAAAFKAAYDSFGVRAKMNRAEQMVKNYKIEGVPTMVVDGKYTVLTLPTDKGHEDLLARTSQVIAKVRAERGGK